MPLTPVQDWLKQWGHLLSFIQNGFLNKAWKVRKKRSKQNASILSANFGCGRRIWTTVLRVMSPTSYQAAPSRVISAWTRKMWCRKPESNRYGSHLPQDFKSWASASSATPAYLSCSSAKTSYHILSEMSRDFRKKFLKNLRTPFPKQGFTDFPGRADSILHSF